MKFFFFILSLLMSFSVCAQSDFDRSVDNENGSIVYNGRFSFEDLFKEPTFDWLKSGEKNYTPDSAAIQFLKASLNQYKLVVFLGTWCDDSQNLIPKLYRTLKLSGYSFDNYEMYGVDRSKETKTGAHSLYKIDKVPTIILIEKDNKEAGRIVEVVKKSIESDLMTLIKENSGNSNNH